MYHIPNQLSNNTCKIKCGLVSLIAVIFFYMGLNNTCRGSNLNVTPRAGRERGLVNPITSVKPTYYSIITVASLNDSNLTFGNLDSRVINTPDSKGRFKPTEWIKIDTPIRKCRLMKRPQSNMKSEEAVCNGRSLGDQFVDPYDKLTL